MYYRVAIQTGSDAGLKWKSTPLTSLEALFQLLRFYKALPQDALRVFMASGREELYVMLAQENDGLLSSSVTAEQFLSERGIHSTGLRQEGVAARMPEPRRTRTGTLTPLAPLSQPQEQEPILKQQSVSTLEMRRIELEMGLGGDHDWPYIFTLPVSTQQKLAWTRLMTRVQQGELQS